METHSSRSGDSGVVVGPVSLFPSATIVLLGWGALAFGAEYSWAYAPVVVFGVAVSLLGFRASRGVRFPSRTLALGLIAVGLAALVQLIPLSGGAVTMVSPSRSAADYRQLYEKATMRTDGAAAVDTGAPLAPEAPRPVSIAPSRTVLGVTFLAVSSLLLVACTRGIAATGATLIARGILALSLMVALVSLLQRGLGSETLYGFWFPPKPGIQRSGPFINQNHTAGWLVMAWALLAGHFGGCVARGTRGVKRDWRHRFLWLSSLEARETLITGFALTLVAMAVIVTVSRSGFLALVFAIVLFGWWAVRRQGGGSRKAIQVVVVVFILLTATAWGGVRAVIQRLQGSELGFAERLEIWQDTLRIIQDYPLTGTGLNTYGIAMLRYQTMPRDELYIEAHNDYLQLAAEGGLLLGIPILLALVLFVHEVRCRFREDAQRAQARAREETARSRIPSSARAEVRSRAPARDDTRTYWLRAGAVTGLGAIAVQEAFDFTLQMPGAAVLFVVLAAIAIHRPSPRSRAIHAYDSQQPHRDQLAERGIASLRAKRGRRMRADWAGPAGGRVIERTLAWLHRLHRLAGEMGAPP